MTVYHLNINSRIYSYKAYIQQNILHNAGSFQCNANEGNPYGIYHYELFLLWENGFYLNQANRRAN